MRVETNVNSGPNTLSRIVNLQDILAQEDEIQPLWSASASAPPRSNATGSNRGRGRRRGRPRGRRFEQKRTGPVQGASRTDSSPARGNRPVRSIPALDPAGTNTQRVLRTRKRLSDGAENIATTQRTLDNPRNDPHAEVIAPVARESLPLSNLCTTRIDSTRVRDAPLPCAQRSVANDSLVSSEPVTAAQPTIAHQHGQSDAGNTGTNDPEPSDWRFLFNEHEPGDISLFTDKDIDVSRLEGLRDAVNHACAMARNLLRSQTPSPVNILRLFWTRDVLTRLSSFFQLEKSGLEKEPSMLLWAQFLSVFLKGSFFNCASFHEIYSLPS